jgi:hypothetical protein
MVQILPWSVLLFALGIPFALWPSRIATLYEVVDAIGRRSAGPVEPADWYVALVRAGGIAFLLVGALGVLGATQ